MELTHRWLKRCIEWTENNPEYYGHKQRLFPIVQDLYIRISEKLPLKLLLSRGAEGNAIGGLSVGEPEEEMYRITDEVTDILPKDKPRYLMGLEHHGIFWNL